jgi:serine/threonine protein kinase
VASSRPPRPSKPPPFHVGDVVAGKYRIEYVLGEGGMGVVFSAHHEILAQSVALKVLRTEALTNGDMLTRFINEARASSRIRSEHVARVMDVGIVEATGAPYIVMELLEGMDLSTRLRKSGALPVAQAVDLVLQALEAVAEAHALGIVHRDLKPANLFLAATPDGGEVLKVLDFGISKATDALALPSSGAGTSTKAILGTPGYMSPEQLRSSRKVDARADIWSIGIVLFEALTRELPFHGETVGDLFGAILEDKPPRLRSLRPDAPLPLDEAVARCIQRKPEDRFGNVLELASALAPFGSVGAALSVERVSRALARSSGSLPGANTGSGSLVVPPSSAIPIIEQPLESAPTVGAGTGPRPFESVNDRGEAETIEHQENGSSSGMHGLRASARRAVGESSAPAPTAASWAASSRAQSGGPRAAVVAAVALIALAMIAAGTILIVRSRPVTYIVVVDAAAGATTVAAASPGLETGPVPLPPPTAAVETSDPPKPPTVPVLRKKPPIVPLAPASASSAKPPPPQPPLDGTSILRDRR